MGHLFFHKGFDVFVRGVHHRRGSEPGLLGLGLFAGHELLVGPPFVGALEAGTALLFLLAHPRRARQIVSADWRLNALAVTVGSKSITSI